MNRIVRDISVVLMVAVFGLASDPATASGQELADPLQTVRQSSEALAKESPWPPRELPASVASPLKTADPDQKRSKQLELIARQADRQTRHGLELAGRGAFFAARAEFLGALRLIAGGLDTEQKTNVHGRALAAALTAVKEADDFLPSGPRLEAELDLPRIIAAHATPVLKTDAENVTLMTAMKCYFTFAQEQFAAAAGHEVAGAMALRALGKLHDTLAGKKGLSEAAAAPKAMVFYQAALLVFPENFMAANDLGVLLARSGNYSSARDMFEYSLSLCRQSTTWRNLVVVYRQLGQTALAERAEQEAAMIEQAEIARRKASSMAGNAPVRWVDPRTLSRMSNGAPNSPGVAQPPAQAAGQPGEPSRLPPVEGDIRTVDRSATGTPSGERRISSRRRSAPTPAAAQRMTWEPPAYQK